MGRNSPAILVLHLFKEAARRLPDEDTLTVLDGLVGAYPNAFYRMTAVIEAMARQSPIDAALPDYGRFGLQ